MWERVGNSFVMYVVLNFLLVNLKVVLSLVFFVSIIIVLNVWLIIGYCFEIYKIIIYVNFCYLKFY